ncbi:MAG: hypothetical protein ACKVXR_01180 [Planctomycetota bacterium]
MKLRLPLEVRRLARMRVLAALTLAVSLLGACDRPASETIGAGASTENAKAGSQGLAFLDRIATAPMTVSYGGKRQVKIHYSIGGVPAHLEYDEQVWSDGQGQFSIVPGKVVQPSMTTEELELFRTLQQARDGFFYRYRDFRIRDLQVFLQNWRVRDLGLEETVAGVATTVLEFRRIDGTLPWYRAWIDPRTALVMRSEERGAGNQIASSVEFLTFELSPDTAGLRLESDQFTRFPLDLSTSTVSGLGFRVRPPSVLPAGYRLARAETTNDGTNTWAILTYTDGVDSLFFLQSFDPQAQVGVSPPGEFNVGPKVVRGYRIGPWTVLQLRSGGDRVFVLGKADSSAIERMLKSSMH